MAPVLDSRRSATNSDASLCVRDAGKHSSAGNDNVGSIMPDACNGFMATTLPAQSYLAIIAPNKRFLALLKIKYPIKVGYKG